MSERTCPELETLFTWLEEGDPRAEQHLTDCEACAALLEEHRQLEKDLLRLADPLPPPNFVNLVMAKVEAQPVPVRREVWTGIAILAAACGGIGFLLLSDTALAGAFGSSVASAVFTLKSYLFAASHGVGALWNHAAVPVATFASLMLMFVLFAVRRVVAGPKEVAVTA